MTSTSEYLALLSKTPCGHIRQLLRDTTRNAVWADEFCDGLVHRLSLQNELERVGGMKINTWLLPEHNWQVNTSPKGEQGWSIVTGDDLLANLVSQLKRYG